MKENKSLTISGMSCAHCELTIENGLSKLTGMENINASYSKGKVSFTYDSEAVSLDEIKNIINKLGYKVVEENKVVKGNKDAKESKAEIEKISHNSQSQSLYILIILIGGYIILKRLGLLNFTNFFPRIQSNMGFGMMFVIGLLTSLHCIAMCGGINLAQSANASKKGASAIYPNLLYNMGRIISYTVIGGIVGALGSVISLGGGFRGAVAIFAGVFMMIMGLNMMNVFPSLRRFTIKMPKFLGRKIGKKKEESHSSFYIGLLNGLMPCGPLQSMQLFALSTGSFFYGALSMFLFSLGTVPLMFGLGALSSKLNKKFTDKMMSICAVLVVVLGIGMLSNGLALSGVALPFQNSGGEAAASQIKDGVQTIITPLDFGTYPQITVKKGIPVKWIIQAEKGKINGCNNEFIIPKYGLEIKLHEGENLIEFTPTEAGQIGYSCWMGMIRSTITVVE
ncbi:urease accessory protein UreH domain-containing protein [Anaerocolumna sp.]|uniref:urease accessory protein UreH domain-containing protein n=1 Tax=Anaerocolumna sp. TaxID=2041569 RepID=UPI0028AE941C|nr:sulfite exporter TauE/SafE family protein [Anaerocolumna sp.]